MSKNWEYVLSAVLAYGAAAILFRLRSMAEFRASVFYPALASVVFLAALVFLRVFGRLIDQMSMRLLIGNRGQLCFVTTSISLINVYLFILSLAYESRPYTVLLMMFLSVTAALLFGAFYTALLHGVRMSLLEEYEIKSKDLERLLEQSNRNIGKLQDYAYSDPLTGLSNRRRGLSGLEELSREGRPFCICLADLDHLKQINDTYGHQEGDRYLLAASRALAEVFSRQNVCRLGGDEFLITASGKTEAEMSGLMREAERRADESWRGEGRPETLSLSFGAVRVENPEKQRLSALLKEADQRMYEMKNGRRAERWIPGEAE